MMSVWCTNPCPIAAWFYCSNWNWYTFLWCPHLVGPFVTVFVSLDVTVTGSVYDGVPVAISTARATLISTVVIW